MEKNHRRSLDIPGETAGPEMDTELITPVGTESLTVRMDSAEKDGLQRVAQERQATAISDDWAQALIDSAPPEPSAAEVERLRAMRKEVDAIMLDEENTSDGINKLPRIDSLGAIDFFTEDEAPTELAPLTPENIEGHFDKAARMQARYDRMKARRSQLAAKAREDSQARARAEQDRLKKEEEKSKFARMRAEAEAAQAKDEKIARVQAEQAQLRLQHETERRQRELGIKVEDKGLGKNTMFAMVGVLAAAIVAGVSFNRNETSQATAPESIDNTEVAADEASRRVINLDTGNPVVGEQYDVTSYEVAPTEVIEQRQSDHPYDAGTSPVEPVMSEKLQPALSPFDSFNEHLENGITESDLSGPLFTPDGSGASMVFDQSTRVDASTSLESVAPYEVQPVATAIEHTAGTASMNPALQMMVEGLDIEQRLADKSDDILSVDLAVPETDGSGIQMNYESSTRVDVTTPGDQLGGRLASEEVPPVKAPVAEIQPESIEPISVRNGSAEELVEVLGKVRKMTVGPLQLKKTLLGKWKVRHMDAPGWVQLDDSMATQLQDIYGFNLLHGIANGEGYTMTPHQFMQMAPDNSSAKRKWNRKNRRS